MIMSKEATVPDASKQTVAPISSDTNSTGAPSAIFLLMQLYNMSDYWSIFTSRPMLPFTGYFFSAGRHDSSLSSYLG